MTKEQIIEEIRKQTNGEFVVPGFVLTTTDQKWDQEYDNKGRPLRANPNYRVTHAVVQGRQYMLVRKGWKAYIFKPNLKTVSYTTLSSPEAYKVIFAEVDLTPDYVKEYHFKQATSNLPKKKK